MRSHLRTVPILTAVWTMLLACAHPAVAENEANPRGTWTWKFANQSAVHSLKLDLDGEKLTGTIKNSQSAPESPIENAAFKNGTVSFKQTYTTRLGQKAVANYVGTFAENTITGTIEFKHPDRTLSREWIATRVSE